MLKFVGPGHSRRVGQWVFICKWGFIKSLRRTSNLTMTLVLLPLLLSTRVAKRC